MKVHMGRIYCKAKIVEREHEIDNQSSGQDKNGFNSTKHG